MVGSYRRHFRVALDGGEQRDCILRGRELTLACGDRVRVELSGDGATIIGVEPRQTLFHRADRFRERLIAANVTLVACVLAADPPCSFDLLDRWIVAAEANGAPILLVINKSDLPATEAFVARLAPYLGLGYAAVRVSAREDTGGLARFLAGETTVLIGQSGVGKSTLINALCPGARASTGELSAALATGRHTTTATTLYRLAGGGAVIDSPGMQEFGLRQLDASALVRGFREIAPLAENCRFRDCRHDREPGCAVSAAVESGSITRNRVESLRTLLAEGRRNHWD